MPFNPLPPKCNSVTRPPTILTPYHLSKGSSEIQFLVVFPVLPASGVVKRDQRFPFVTNRQWCSVDVNVAVGFGIESQLT